MCTAESARRREQDALGTRELPAEAYYGIHTARAIDNFRLGNGPCAAELIDAYATIKRACARCNAQLGYLPANTAAAIVQAVDELLEGGLLRASIVVDALQGGAGTSLNMNLNEVLANRAEEILGGRRGEYRLVDPLAHVNLHQSTNDTFPSALRLAAIRLLRQLQAAVAELQDELQKNEQAFADVVKLGRTQLQDACPTTLGRSFSAFAEAIGRDRWRIAKCEERLRVVNLGGTAIGSGLAAPRDYLFQVVETLREETGLGLARADNLTDATQNADAFVEVSGILKAHAVNLLKISNDLRLLASGPTAGLGEISLPKLQAGSSIMPGKANPVICEAVAQAAMQSIADDTAITLAAQAGQLELNAFLPLLAHALIGSLKRLCAVNRVFAQRGLRGIEAHREHCASQVARATSTATALLPLLGYALAQEVAAAAQASGQDIATIIRQRRLLSAEQVETALSAAAMTTLGFVAGEA